MASAQQYTVHSWESFESGTIPENMVRFHHSSKENVQVLNLRSPHVPAKANTGTAAVECGQYAVGFAPTEDAQLLSLFTPDGLNRDRLGQNGRALYQADFYLPAEGTPFPSMALLAQVIGDQSDTLHFYRFGLIRNGQRVYFSYTNKEEAPLIYIDQKLSEFNLSRPGWHRFQIIFLGPDQIYCAIDGQMTSYSPITEGTYKTINAGVMITSKTSGLSGVVDNLSIQWTAEEAPLPVSPWTSIPENAAIPNTTPLESGQSVYWLNESAKAWEMVQLQKRPLLMMFYSPNIDPYRYTKSIIPNNEEAYSLFNKYVLLKFDANQLNGGRMASRFNVNRLPTFVLLDPTTGKETKRLVVKNRQTSWDEMKSFF